jgi:hypothetical protein
MSENVKIKMWKTILLPFFYSAKFMSLDLSIDSGIQRVLRRIFVPSKKINNSTLKKTA